MAPSVSEARDPSSPGCSGLHALPFSFRSSAVHSPGPFRSVHSRSARNVSSTEGSSSPMLESLNMLSPSRLRGSIWSSSSSGNGVSMFRLISGMPASALLRSLNRLVLESSGRSSKTEKQCRLGGTYNRCHPRKRRPYHLPAGTAMACISPQLPASSQDSNCLPSEELKLSWGTFIFLFYMMLFKLSYDGICKNTGNTNSIAELRGGPHSPVRMVLGKLPQLEYRFGLR